MPKKPDHTDLAPRIDDIDRRLKEIELAPARIVPVYIPYPVPQPTYWPNTYQPWWGINQPTCTGTIIGSTTNATGVGFGVLC